MTKRHRHTRGKTFNVSSRDDNDPMVAIFDLAALAVGWGHCDDVTAVTTHRLLLDKARAMPDEAIAMMAAWSIARDKYHQSQQ